MYPPTAVNPIVCPAPEALEKLLREELDPTEIDIVEEHVNACPSCQRMLDQLVGSLPDALHPLVAQDETRSVPDVAPRTERGAEVPGYEILGELGWGGMGVVYKARQIGLNRLVALKMISAGAGASPPTRARFRVEAMAAARLQHPHIVQVHEIGEHCGQPYFSLELVEGGTLAQKLAGQPQPADQAAFLIETLARAVHHAHQHGVIHRDLKPANILLTSDGTPKISDFGLAKCLEDDMGLTRTGTIVGTPSYMAPEQAIGPRSAISPAADIYALGVILYEMLTGRPPFCALTPLETLELVRTQEPLPPRRFQPSVPRDLETICLQCLAKEPSKRYTSALDLAEDLDRYRTGKAIRARPVHALERAWRWCRRNPVPASLLACVGLLLAVIAAGASLAVWRLERERGQAVANQQEAEQAREETKEQLWNALVAQARANRRSGQPGRNFDSLDVLSRAATLRPSLELRNEAIACMALPDLRLVSRWDFGLPRYFGWAFDVDLKRYAFSDEQGTISIRRFADNRELLRLPGSGIPAWVMHFSPGSRYLAARCHRQYGDTNTILVWDIGRAIETGATPAPPIRLSGRLWDFHPNKPYLAASCADKSLRLYDLSGEKPTFLVSKNEPLQTLAFDPGGRRLAAARDYPLNDSGDKIYPISVYDVETGRCLLRLRSSVSLYSLSWRKDGRRLAGAAADGNVYMWELPAERPIKTLIGHQNSATCVAFHPSGELLVSSSWDGSERLWDAETGRQLLSSPALHARFSRDGGRLALLLDGARVGLYDLDLGHVCRTLYDQTDRDRKPSETNQGLWSTAFHPNKPLLATSSDNDLRLWDAESGRVFASQPLPGSRAVLFLPDGDLLTSSSSGVERWRLTPAAASNNGRACLDRLPWTGPTLRGTQRMALDAEGRILAVLVGESQAVLLGGDRWTNRLLDLTTAQACCIALSPNGRWAATGTWRGKGTRIWDLQNGQHVNKELPGGDALVAFSPDGRWLVNGTKDEYRFWELGSWRPGLRIPRTPEAVAGPLAFTPDGRILAIAHSRRNVRLVETATGRELATLIAPDPHQIHWLCFRPDGEQLAVACSNRVLRLWDLKRIRERLAEMGLDWGQCTD